MNVRNRVRRSKTPCSFDILNCQNVPFGTRDGSPCSYVCVRFICVHDLATKLWLTSSERRKSLKCWRARQSTSVTVAVRQSKLVSGPLRQEYDSVNYFPIVLNGVREGNDLMDMNPESPLFHCLNTWLITGCGESVCMGPDWDRRI